MRLNVPAYEMIPHDTPIETDTTKIASTALSGTDETF